MVTAYAFGSFLLMIVILIIAFVADMSVEDAVTMFTLINSVYFILFLIGVIFIDRWYE